MRAIELRAGREKPDGPFDVFGSVAVALELKSRLEPGLSRSKACDVSGGYLNGFDVFIAVFRSECGSERDAIFNEEPMIWWDNSNSVEIEQGPDKDMGERSPALHALERAMK